MYIVESYYCWPFFVDCNSLINLRVENMVSNNVLEWEAERVNVKIKLAKQAPNSAHKNDIVEVNY